MDLNKHLISKSSILGVRILLTLLGLMGLGEETQDPMMGLKYCPPLRNMRDNKKSMRNISNINNKLKG